MLSPNTRVLIDTNIFISALITSNSVPNKILSLWQNDYFTLLTSYELIEEIKQVLLRDSIAKSFKISSNVVDEIISLLYVSAEIILPLSLNHLPISSRDQKDNIVLASALGGKADFLITGDKDLQILNKNKKLPGLTIISPRNFITLSRKYK